MKLFLLLFSIFIINYSVIADESSINIGIAALYNESMYKGIDNQRLLLPFLEINYNSFSISFQEISYKFSETNNKSFTIKTKYIDEFYDNNDSDFLKDMKKRKGGLFLGTEFSYKPEILPFNISIEIFKDIISHSNGLSADLTFSSFLPIYKNIFIIPSIQFNFLNSNYINSAFGVSSDEEKADRKKYNGSDSINLSYNAVTIFNINHKLSFMIISSFSKLNKNIYNSPIIDKKDNFTFLTSFVYKFLDK